MEIRYDRGVPVYRQIYEAVVHWIAAASVAEDDKLPTIHELAAAIAVNPNTVAHAYRELERDGHIRSQRGKGSYPVLPARLTMTRAQQEERLARVLDETLTLASSLGLSPPDVFAYFAKQAKRN